MLKGSVCERRPGNKIIWMSGDVSAPPSPLEVASFIGKTVGAGAALTAAVYLLRKVCLIMAWKSGGASHAELVTNLRSESCSVFKVASASNSPARRWKTVFGRVLVSAGAVASWLLKLLTTVAPSFSTPFFFLPNHVTPWDTRALLSF